MTDTVRDAKLVQYLSEAYAKEKELETALQAHIGMTTRKPYKKRLQDHLKETKAHARGLERRIKQIGGSGPQLADKVVGQVTGQVKSLAKGPLHMVRGTEENEKMLKNAKTEYFNEHEEIATYTAIETLAEAVGDKETAKLARDIRREEERMAKFLFGQITSLTKAVVTEEIPASERRKSSSRRSSSRRRSAGASSRSSGSSSKSRTGSSSKSSSTRRRASGSSSTRKRSASSGSTRKRTASSGSTRKRAASSGSTRKRASSSGPRSRSRSSSSGSTRRKRS